MTSAAPECAPPASGYHRRRRALPIVTAGAASLIAVIVLWLHGGNLGGLLTGGTAAFVSAGRLAGLVAADLLLAQVLLIARVPWIERACGHVQLARWHRRTGSFSVSLVAVHVAIVVTTNGHHRPLRHATWHLVTTVPGVLLATTGTVALGIAAATSVRAARRRMRYETWHLLHLYAYIGVGLSLPHELLTGADFVADPLARAYWWAVYAGTAGCVVAFRAGLPVWRTVRHNLRVVEITDESADVTSIYLSGRHLHRMRVQAGQFFNWRFLGAPGWTRAHPYSLSAAPGPDRLRITVRKCGDGSSAVSALRPGMRVFVEGPYGRLTGTARQRQHLTFLAYGIGITPIRALLEAVPYRSGEAVLIYRAVTSEDFLFGAELEQLAAERGVAIHYLPGRHQNTGTWLPDGHASGADTLRQLAPHVAISDVYLCGPRPWMAAATRALSLAGVSRRQIHQEPFAW